MNVSCPLYFNQVNRHVVLMSSSQPNVALFVTCLVDLFRPSVGFATVKLMEEAGCKVVKVVSILDRNEGGSEEMRKRGYDFSALLAATPDGKIEPAAD